MRLRDIARNSRRETAGREAGPRPFSKTNMQQPLFKTGSQFNRQARSCCAGRKPNPTAAPPAAAQINRYCRALLRKNGKPSPITSASSRATGRHTDRP